MIMQTVSGFTVVRCRLFRRLICILCSFLLITPPSLIAQSSTENPLPIEGVDHTFALAEYDLNQIDETRFHIEALQQKIGSNPSLLTDWVRTKTRWVPYVGALKGAPGTLLARQGNLLDRSLLLAALLEASGRQVRIAWFETTNKNKKVLRAAASHQITGGVLGSIHVSDDLESRHTPDESGGLAGGGVPRLFTDRANAEQSLRNKVKKTLWAQHAQLATLTRDHFDPIYTSPWDDSLKRYFYVEYRDPESVEWNSGHLLPTPLRTAQEIHRFSTNHVPVQFLHIVTVRIVAIKEQSGVLTESTALQQSIATANLGATRVRIGMSPATKTSLAALISDLYQSKSSKPLIQYLSSADSWVPTIRTENQQLVIGKTIRANGDVTTAPGNLPDTSSTASLSTTLEKLDLLSSSNQEIPGSFLHAVRVEFDIQPPGERQAETIIRPIYRRISQSPTRLTQSEKVARSAALSFRSSLLVTGGFFSMAYARAQQSQGYLELRLASRYLSTKDNDDWIKQGDELSPMIRLLEKLDVFPTKLYGITALRSIANNFLNRPNILGYWKHVHFDSPDHGYIASAVDLIENRISSLDYTAREAFNAQLLSGLRDTIIETAVESRTQQAVSTSSLFQEDQGLGWLVIQPDDPSPLRALELPTVTHEAIERDLAENYLVVLRPDIREHSVAWWRLNTRTGELLGMTGSRHRIGGQSLTETIVIGIAITVVVGLLFDTLLEVSESPCAPVGSAPAYNYLTRHLKSLFAKFWEEAEALPGVGECGEPLPL